MQLKEKIKQLQYSSNFLAQDFYRSLKACKHVYLIVSNARYRAEWRVTLGQQHFQVATFTKKNRYPLLFRECANYLATIPQPTILSFGCSTGEEVQSIQDYLPNAVVYGVDINAWCLEQCKQHYQSAQCFFFHRHSTAFEQLHKLHAIFCMAVFQHTENRTSHTNIATAFTFQQFEAEMLVLHAKLAVGGLFIIDHCDFDFSETTVATHYKPLDFNLNKLVRHRPLFNKNNNKIADTTELYRVFVKL